MKEIIVDGHPIPIHFGTGAIRRFTQGGKRDFGEVVSGKLDDSLDTLFELICIGLNYGAERKGVDKRYTQQDVEFMVDDNPGIIREALQIFQESVYVIQSALGDIVQGDPPGNAPRPKAAGPRATRKKSTR